MPAHQEGHVSRVGAPKNAYLTNKLLLAALLCWPLALSAQPPARDTPTQPIVKDFESLDKDGDGYITRAEAEGENIFYHWDAADANKDDVISREEFIDYIAEEEPRLGVEQPLEELPQADLRERLGGGASRAVTNPELLPQIRNDFRSLDSGNSRQLTRDDVRGDAIFEHFSHIDRNSDGVISEDEYNDYLFRYGTQVATEELVDQVQGLR